MTRKLPQLLFALAALGGIACVGCQHRVVSAAMPAPMPAQPIPQRQTPPAQPPPVIPPASDPSPQAQLPAVDPEPSPAAPASSRASVPAHSASSEAAKPTPEPQPAAPVIAPALSQQDLANAIRQTNRDQTVALRTLQVARNKRLNTSQADLLDKVKGFLDQTEDAKKANDWVRAQNLAHKAQVLAAELMKSL